jgi:hypothetical protein
VVVWYWPFQPLIERRLDPAGHDAVVNNEGPIPFG